MIAITKSMVVLSALTSAGLIAAVDNMGAATHTDLGSDLSANGQVTQRFPLPNEMFVPATTADFGKMAEPARKTSRLPLPDPCQIQGPPYPSPQCLMSVDGGPVRKVDRVITIHRGVGPNTSELLRVAAADMAQR